MKNYLDEDISEMDVEKLKNRVFSLELDKNDNRPESCLGISAISVLAGSLGIEFAEMLKEEDLNSIMNLRNSYNFLSRLVSQKEPLTVKQLKEMSDVLEGRNQLNRFYISDLRKNLLNYHFEGYKQEDLRTLVLESRQYLLQGRDPYKMTPSSSLALPFSVLAFALAGIFAYNGIKKIRNRFRIGKKIKETNRRINSLENSVDNI